MGELEVVHELVAHKASFDLTMQDGSTALEVAKKLGKTDVVQFLEHAEENVNVTRALQVFADMDAASIILTCTSMAGDELAKFTLDSDAKLHILFRFVDEHLPLQVGSWTIISPTGETLDRTQ